MRSLWIAHSSRGSLRRLTATLCLVNLLLITLHTRLSYAGDGNAIGHRDYSHARIIDAFHDSSWRLEAHGYESNFLGLDRSIIGRAEDDQALANNAPGQLNIEQGDSQFWTFPKQALFGPKSPPTPGLPNSLLQLQPIQASNSSDEVVLYISLTTCRQPNPKSPGTLDAPAQLQLFVSTDSGNKQPDSKKSDHIIAVDGGFGWLNISVKSDVYFGVVAPTNDDFEGVYNYQLTASIDGFYASHYDEPNLAFIDSDASSALLYTNDTATANTSQPEFHEWMDSPLRFTIFVQNQANPSILGMQNSICALSDYADIRVPTAFDTSMTLAGNDQPKQQFYVRTLNASSSYYGISAIVGNSTKSGNGVVGGGGTVFRNSTFWTKSSENCALVYNLTFCTSVAYSAPANFKNPSVADVAALRQKYDNYSNTQYVNFSRSLQQIPCDTTSSAQYSLTRTCHDCDKAYREWLCAVTIPRCEDFDNPAPYLQPRAVNQSFTNTTLGSLAISSSALTAANKSGGVFAPSRNPMIDMDIAPGPYKEVLPCEDLCYKLVQSCPAALQFKCPIKNHGLSNTYAKINGSSPHVTCNFPGAGIIQSSNAIKLRVFPVWIMVDILVFLITICF